MATSISHCAAGSSEWNDIEVPVKLADSFPEDFVQGCWNQLFDDFVAHIRGDAGGRYPTFHDGWVAAELIDIARDRTGWRVLEDPPTS